MPKIAPKTAQNLQNLNISVRIDPKPTVEGGHSCFELSSQDRFRRRSGNVENIQEYLWTRGLLRSRAAESSYILEGKAGRGIYILENILEY